MATAAPFVKLLRQLSTAKDEYRSGALDISWDGTKASLYFVFGQPNHATYQTEGESELLGQEALAALLHTLPPKFTVAAWRKAVTREETLKMSLEELMEPFAQLAGKTAPEELAPAPPATASVRPSDSYEVGTGFSADFDFALEDFPLLPLGESMWSDAALNVVHLDLLIPKLPTTLIVLTGPNLRAAALTLSGRIVDAVWVDESERAAGEGAAMALMGAREGTVSCYRLDDPKLVEALTMLWRCPARHRNIDLPWLDAQRLVESIRSDRRDCVLRIDGSVSGLAFFLGGEFVAGYTSENRVPTTSIDATMQLLAAGGGTVTVLERAGDRTAVHVPTESEYHAYVGAGAETAAPAPSYAAGAAAIGADPDLMEAPEALPTEPKTARTPEAAAEPGADPTPADSSADAAGESALEITADAPQTAEIAATGVNEVPAEFSRDFSAETPGENHGQSEPIAPATDEATETSAGEIATPTDEEAPLAEVAAAPLDPDQVAEDDVSGDDGADIAADFFGTSPATGLTESGHEWFTPPAASEPVADPGAYAPVELESKRWDTEPVEAAVGSEPAAHEAAAAAGDSPFIFGMEEANGATAAAESAVAEEDEDESFDSPRLELDFEGIKQDLIQIGVLWLGSDDVAPVAELIRNTKPSVDDFVSTIDAIKAISVSGHDPSVIRAMAREMHYHAAEYLSGA